MFVTSGVDAVMNPEPKAPKVERVGVPLARRMGLPDDPVAVVRINGGLQLVAALLLAMGWFPRLAAAALAASLVPTTLAGHRFWEETDKAAKLNHRLHFLKNTAILGGLILAATDTEGRPSLSWRARKAAQRASQALPVGD